eukprot:1522236-Pleurochrysis_carterae.AAC.2
MTSCVRAALRTCLDRSVRMPSHRTRARVCAVVRAWQRTCARKGAGTRACWQACILSSFCVCWHKCAHVSSPKSSLCKRRAECPQRSKGFLSSPRALLNPLVAFHRHRLAAPTRLYSHRKLTTTSATHDRLHLCRGFAQAPRPAGKCQGQQDSAKASRKVPRPAGRWSVRVCMGRIATA